MRQKSLVTGQAGWLQENQLTDAEEAEKQSMLHPSKSNWVRGGRIWLGVGTSVKGGEKGVRGLLGREGWAKPPEQGLAVLMSAK